MQSDQAFVFGCVVFLCCLGCMAFFLALAVVFALLCYKLYKDRTLKTAYFLMVFTPSGKPDSAPIVRIMDESEFNAFDASKVFVKFQLRNCDKEYLKKTAEDKGWKQTVY